MRSCYELRCIFFPRCCWWIVILSLGALSCGEGGPRVLIDPDARLLRDDLVGSATGSVSHALSARTMRHDRMRFDTPTSRRALIKNAPIEVLLMQSVSVTSEDVSLTLDPTTRSLFGTATATVSAPDQDLSSVSFSLSAKTIDSVIVNESAVPFSYQNEILTITPDSPFSAGTPLTIGFAWSDAAVSRTMDYSPEGGINFVSDLLDENSTFFSSQYQFWPRLVGQSVFNNLAFQVTYPADRTLVMSGRKTDSMNVGNGESREDTWNIEAPFQGKVGLALADYEKVTGSCGTTNIEIYAILGISIDTFPINPSVYAPVLSSYCDQYRAWFGAPAFATIRFVGVDDRFDSGLATPGMVLVPNYTWDDDGSGSFAERDFFLAHELTHQWWGNDVFIGSSADGWLIEGMADFTAGSTVESARGQTTGRGMWLWEVEPLLSYYQAGGADHPLVPEAGTTMEPRIYYIKGAWVLRMLESVIGNEALFHLLGQFRAAHPFSFATTAEFTSLSAQISGQNLDWFFNEWLYGLGLLSLSEKHTEKNGGIEVTITQKKPWAKNLDQYFVMPITVRIENDGRSSDETMQLAGIESTATLTLP